MKGKVVVGALGAVVLFLFLYWVLKGIIGFVSMGIVPCILVGLLVYLLWPKSRS